MAALVVVQDTIYSYDSAADRCAGQHIGNIVIDGIVLCVTALHYIERCLRTVAESIVVHGGCLAGDNDLAQDRAAGKRIVADVPHTAGDLDGLEVIALIKSGGANVAQCSVRSKLNGGHICKCKQICTDVLDAAPDPNGPDLLNIVDVGTHTIALEVIGPARAIKDHPAILIDDISNVIAKLARIEHIGVGAADVLAGLKEAGFTAEVIIALIGQAGLIKQIELIGKLHITRNRLPGGEEHLPAAVLISGPSVILQLSCILRVAADGAFQFAGGPVIHIRVLVVCTDGSRALGELIQHRPGAVGGHVIGGDGGLEAVGGDVHIDAVEVQGGHVKVEVGIVHDGIGLAAGGAADVVHRAVFVHLTAGHGGGAGIAVVVAGEVEVDAGRIAGCGQILHIGFAAAGGIGVVGGHVGHQHLPGAGALDRILHQPLGELLKGILVGGVVQHGNIHVAALHGVPGGGHAEDALGGDGVIAAVIGLVVADHVDHIRVADAVQSEQGQGVLPLVIVADVVHRVAQLDAEGILPSQMIGDASHALQGGLLLDIGQQEEPGLLFGGGHGEAADLRPDGAVAHLVIVGGPGLKARQRHRIDAVDLLAGGIGDQAAFALHLRSAGHVGAGRDPGHGPGGAVDGIAHPGDGLAVGALGQVIDHIIGSAGFIPHSVIAVQGDLIGAVALRVGGPQVHAALGGRQAGDVDPAVFIGNAQ